MIAARTVRSVLWALAVVVPLAAGCGASSDTPTDDAPAPAQAPLHLLQGCQPLLATTSAETSSKGTCLVPYPSDFYRDTSGPVPRIMTTGAAKFTRPSGVVDDPHDARVMSGFPLTASVVAALPTPVARDGLPAVDADPLESAKPTSATILLDATTGLLVPHYTDKFDRVSDPAHTPLVMHPFSPLDPGHRYVAALQGVKRADEDGGVLPELAPPAEGFRRLRDHELALDPSLVPLAARFDAEIFAPLSAAGVARASLQLAWDFTTGSDETPRADMRQVRALTLAWLASETPAVTISAVTPSDNRLWKTIQGTLTAPLFLDQPGVTGRLVRGQDGQVTQNGTTTFPFLVTVPLTVRDRFAPGRAIAMGHGFFGGRDELLGNGGRTLADQASAVVFGIDWWGMSKDDLPAVAETIVSNARFAGSFAERVHQAMANWLVTTHAMREIFHTLPEFRRGDSGEGVVTDPSGASNALQPLYDPSFIGYYGASLGHILGGTLAAIDDDIQRVAVNVGGAGFSQIMPRSGNFGPFSIMLDVAYGDELVIQAFQSAFQSQLDSIDPVTWAPLIVAQKKPVLIQTGLGDVGVPNIASFYHARALQLRQTMPAPRTVFGLPPQSAESESALTLFDFGVDTSASSVPEPLPLNDVHDGLRLNPAAVREVVDFLAPNGVLRHPCDGPCDPL